MLRIFAFLILFASGAFAQVPMTGAGVGAPSSGATFVGPGDINGAAFAWWGLRAYTAAYATALGNVADIVDTATGLASCTIKAKANGDADLTSTSCVGGTLSVTTFCTVTHAAGCSVTKLYDQTGSGNDVVNATLASMPLLVLSASGGKPGFSVNGSSFLTDSSLVIGPTQIFTVSLVAKRTALSGGFETFLSCNGTVQSGFDSGANGLFIFAGSGPPAPLAAADNAFHAVQNIFNTTSSTISSDGTTSGSLNAGTGDCSATLLTVGAANSSLSNPMTGVGLEGGFWAGNKSANTSAMNSNQHTYWGF